MDAYTSGRVYHDPNPVAYITKAGHLSQNRTGILELPKFFPDMYAYAPRREFDNHNPILVAFRANPDMDIWDMAFAMFETYGGTKDWDQLGHDFHCFTVATSDEVEHASRVLSRLAVLGEVS